ncbi:MAG: hypothetical protein R8F63_08365 [Acidimicrobiales bacterium]|nr:hypothetical protein [Acidimicrobiales bacterium]
MLLRRGREAARSGPALLVLALLVLALLAVGCGDDAPSAEPTEAPTTTEAPRKTHVPTTTEAPTTTQAPATAEGADFIELPFFSGFVWESFGDTEADCDTSDPDREVCSFEQTGTLYGTHLGQALDAESGTRTTYLDESCTGSDGSIGNPVVYEASGSMTTLSGDEAFFRLRNPLCSVATPLVANWVIDGGTGRFEDAYGIMSVMPWPGDEFTSVSTGTLRVRADLWEEILPPLTAP